MDVVLHRQARAEIAVVELVDLIADGGEAMRGLADKVAAIRRDHPRDRVLGLLVVRATRRNRALLHELDSLLAVRFPSRSAEWIAALTRPDAPMPPGDGLVWARVDGTSLFAGATLTTIVS